MCNNINININDDDDLKGVKSENRVTVRYILSTKRIQ